MKDDNSYISFNNALYGYVVLYVTRFMD